MISNLNLPGPVARPLVEVNGPVPEPNYASDEQKARFEALHRHRATLPPVEHASTIAARRRQEIAEFDRARFAQVGDPRENLRAAHDGLRDARGTLSDKRAGLERAAQHVAGLQARQQRAEGEQARSDADALEALRAWIVSGLAAPAGERAGAREAKIGLLGAAGTFPRSGRHRSGR